MIEIKDCRKKSLSMFKDLAGSQFFFYGGNFYFKFPPFALKSDYYNCFCFYTDRFSSIDCDALVQPVNVSINIMSNEEI